MTSSMSQFSAHFSAHQRTENVTFTGWWWWEDSEGGDDRRRLPLHFHLIIVRGRDPGPGLAGEAGRPLLTDKAEAVVSAERGQLAAKEND